jgi:hypothetical protein
LKISGSKGSAGVTGGIAEPRRTCGRPAVLPGGFGGPAGGSPGVAGGGGGFLQDFLRLRKKAVMDFTFLDKCSLAIRPETWKRVNERLGRYGVAQGVVNPKVVRTDTTVMESNIHYPTDSSLRWDTWRVQPMPPNRPPLSVEMGITAEPPRFPVHQCVHKRPSATKTK